MIVTMKEVFGSGNILATMFNIILAGAGGVCSFLLDDKHVIVDLIKIIILSAFTGLMTLLILTSFEFELSNNMVSFFVAGSGLASRSILKFFKLFVEKFIQKSLNKLL